MKNYFISACTIALTSTLFLSACSQPDNSSAADDATAATSDREAEHEHKHEHEGEHDHKDAEDPQALTEVSQLSPRLVLSHDKGLTTLDPLTGDEIDEIDEPGFHRLNSVGNSRHLLVSTPEGFDLFDTGTIAEAHGDHHHYYEKAPELTNIRFSAGKPGHVVDHEGKTALFDDATGKINIFATEELQQGTDTAEPAQVRTVKSGEAHHGVAVPFADDSYLTTVGTEDDRHRIEYRSGTDEVLAATDDCPDIHGEAVAAGNRVAFGCTNGPVVFDVESQQFHKVDASEIWNDGYQRSGNLAGSENSPIILGDHKTDKDAEQENPTEVALIDTRDHSISTVALDDTYWFRSLARTESGDGVVLTADGYLNIIDVEDGTVTSRIKAIEPWEEKDDWQEPGPIVKVEGTTAFVTDAKKQELIAIDLDTEEILHRTALDYSPVEMAIAH